MPSTPSLLDGIMKLAGEEFAGKFVRLLLLVAIVGTNVETLYLLSSRHC